MLVAALLAFQTIASVQVAPANIAAAANQPQLAIGPDGHVFIAYGADDRLYVAKSLDGGYTFEKPVVLGDGSGRLSLGMRRGPRIAANKSRVVVTAIYGELGGGKDGDLVAWRSPDGEKWDGPVKVSDEPGAAREGLHAMGSGADGTFVAVWLDMRGPGTELVASYSTNGGRSWAKNNRLYASPDGSICECCHPSLGFGPFGEVTVMFRNSFRGNRDMYRAASPDGGRSWGPASKIGTVSWQLAACPMDGGAIAFDTSGETVSIWRKESTLYLARGSTASEFGTGKNPWITTTKTGVHTVWETNSGAVYYQSGTSATTRRRLAESGSDPVLLAVPGAVLAAWRGKGPSPGVYVARLPKKAEAP